MSGQGQETTLCPVCSSHQTWDGCHHVGSGESGTEAVGLAKGQTGSSRAATLCKEGKGLAKAFHYLPVSHMSKSSFQLEAKAYHWPDPSQISPATRQTLRPKIVPVLSRLTPSTGGGRWPWVEAQPSPCPAEHLSGALLWVSRW